MSGWVVHLRLYCFSSVVLSQTAWHGIAWHSFFLTWENAGDRHQAYLLLPKAVVGTKPLPSFKPWEVWRETGHRTALSDELLGSMLGYIVQVVRADTDGWKWNLLMPKHVHQQRKPEEIGGQTQDLESTTFLRLSAFRVVTCLLALLTAPWQSTMPALLFSNICFPLFKGCCSLFLCSILLLKHTRKVVGQQMRRHEMPREGLLNSETQKPPQQFWRWVILH